MAKYIECEAAKNAFPRAEADAFENCRYCTCLDSEQIGEILDNVPAADVAPVRHGRWEKGHCTRCGEDVASRLDIWTNVQRFLYCPFCGALMDEDGDGDA